MRDKVILNIYLYIDNFLCLAELKEGGDELLALSFPVNSDHSANIGVLADKFGHIMSLTDLLVLNAANQVLN